MGGDADPNLLDGLRAAVEAAPGNSALRLHLAEVLLAAGEPAEALTHCTTVLAAEPAHVEALHLAAQASAAAGQDDKAGGYRQLADALVAANVPEREKLGVSDSLESEADVDRFLEEVLGADDPGRRVTLADVAGLDDVKRRLHASFLGPMRNAELRKLYGKSLRGGLLLWGPPGCGKTFLARAAAGELGAQFIGVGLHDILDMWLGQSERNLHDVFETARARTPCVLFLDEVDALGQKRSHLTHSGGRNVVVQLLTELDSLRDDNEGLFVLGATNQPWDVDPALRRPGRFDRTVLVLPPDRDARRAILEYHLRDRPVANVDLNVVAAATEGCSGADLRLICESAAETALEDSLASGVPRPIGMADMQGAVKDVSPSTRPWFETARNYALFANEGGSYDDLLAYMRKHRLV